MPTVRLPGTLVASTRAPRRWLGLGASALLTAGVLLVAPTALPVASAADCADAEVIFARGTDEPPGMGRVGDAFVDALRKQATGLNIDSYAVNYKAGKLQLHGGDGANDVISHIKQTVSSCPDTKIILGGYSQGASVMDIVAGVPVGGIPWGSSLPPEYVKNIAAVATFGNVATRTNQALPTTSALLGNKAIDMCNPADPICHAGPGNEWSGHTQGYVPGYTDQAASFAAAKLLAGYTQHLPGYGPPPGYDQATTGYGPATMGYDPDSASHGLPPGYPAEAPGPTAPGPVPAPATVAPTTAPTSSSQTALAAELH
ncbi:cutinase [Mycobacterium sp. BK086]|uniref:cutinase family protein n=1 Tax=Mycobacterium sp. BK086 TaxID=2512165 RepID=UPI00105EFC6B|nr:cutinase family protein [Mycobacterium sp. BK086]TDO18102.1 cutinase [Mycobacterium sp. BK086]